MIRVRKFISLLLLLSLLLAFTSPALAESYDYDESLPDGIYCTQYGHTWGSWYSTYTDTYIIKTAKICYEKVFHYERTCMLCNGVYQFKDESVAYSHPNFAGTKCPTCGWNTAQAR